MPCADFSIKALHGNSFNGKIMEEKVIYSADYSYLIYFI